MYGLKFFLSLAFLNVWNIAFADCEENFAIFFGSLNSQCVNARIGPGEQYPIIFTYKNKKFLPVKITATYGNWYKVVDQEGDAAWVAKNLLSKRKTVSIKDDCSILYKSPDKNSIKLAKLEKNVIGVVEKCSDKNFIKIKINNMKGWVLKDNVFGI